MEMSILQTHKVYCKVKATHAFRKKSDFSKSPIPVSLSSWAHLLKHTTA
jgi:hypothetical protein